MITWVRTANINHGKYETAIEWAIRVSAYVNEKYGTNVRVQVNVAGPYNQLHWAASYDSLAGLEDLTNKLMMDEGYRDLLRETTEAENFETKSVVDAIYRTIG